MCGNYKAGNRCDEAFQQLKRIADAELEPLYQAMKDLKPREETRSDRAIQMLAKIAKAELKELEELIEERRSKK